MSLRSEKLGVAFKKDYEETTVDQISQMLHEMREDGTMEEIRSALFSVLPLDFEKLFHLIHKYTE